MTQAVAVAPPAGWDPSAIKAEVNRRGMTLTGIARKAGLPDSACRRALLGVDRKGADAIATALGIPFDELFPTGFLQSRSSEREATAKASGESRQKHDDMPDGGGSSR